MGATRAWWTLTSWGFSDVRVLDGGLNAWKAAGGTVGTGPANAVAPADFDEASLTDNAAMVATAEDVLLATSSDDVQIMDTLAGWPNTAERYGKRYGAERQGHISSAFNVPCGELLQPDGCFKPEAELRQYFEQQGTDLSAPLIAY
jgi:thiosulfate/3-mercaptopyruvate sulfurtransferase